MKNTKRRARLMMVAAATAVVVVTGLVYAAWTTNGSGSGYAKAGTSSPLSTVDVSASTSATLYPGGNGDVLIKISNPNPYPVRVTDISLNGTNSDIAADSTHASAGCNNTSPNATGVSFSDQTGLSIDIPAKSGGVNGSTQTTLNNAASMSNASANACQGATFTIPVNISAASNA